MMIRLVFLTALVVVSGAWILTSTHTDVISKVTHDVTLVCFHRGAQSPADAATVSLVTGIRLLKHNYTDACNTYAELVSPNVDAVKLTQWDVPSVTPSGHLGQPDDTFLSVTWSSFSQDMCGKYVCEVNGFAADGETMMTIKTNAIAISNRDASIADLQTLAVETEKKTEELSKELKVFKEKMASDMKTLSAIPSTEFTNAIMQRVKSYTNELHKDKELRSWPSGKYGLLNTKAGCPDTPVSGFLDAYMTTVTDTWEKPGHNFNDAPHLPSDVISRRHTRNSLKLRFCVHDTQKPEVPWPKGHYCVAYFEGCPAGFEFLFLRWHLTSTSRTPTGSIEYGRNVDRQRVTMTLGGSPVFDLRFCCRGDGPVNVPIKLPNTKPFYLYRYRGVCQTVYQMDLLNESFRLEPEEGTPVKYFSDPYNKGFVLHDDRVTFCYYTPKN